MTGTLKGYDQLMNLVLDDVKEVMRGRPLSFPRGAVAIRTLTTAFVQMTKATRTPAPSA